MVERVSMSEEFYFVSEKIRPKGFAYPKSYYEFVSNKSNGAAIVGMPPWIFASNELWAMQESEDVFGRQLIPFAQAENLDMIAYFEVPDDSGEPVVWLANPWANSTDTWIYGKFENFETWLKRASQISNDFLKEHPHYREKKFWFPDRAR